MDFTGFKPFDFTEGVPYFSVTKNGVTFNKAVAMKLGYPAYTRLLINAETKQVAVEACQEDTPHAVPFLRNRDQKILSVRWSSKDLVSSLNRLQGGTIGENGFRVEGVLADENTMLFDLNDAKELL